MKTTTTEKKIKKEKRKTLQCLSVFKLILLVKVGDTMVCFALSLMTLSTAKEHFFVLSQPALLNKLV